MSGMPEQIEATISLNDRQFKSILADVRGDDSARLVLIISVESDLDIYFLRKGVK